MPLGLLDDFQIILSRPSLTELDDSRLRILWLHDLPTDQESQQALQNGGWARYHRIVFVSNWQMQRYIDAFQIPWSKCVVMRNAIEPLAVRPPRDPNDKKIKLVYTSTPQRGLNILYAVFEKLAETDLDIELHVYSSFKIYNWLDRDSEYQTLYDMLEKHPQCFYHGCVSNDEIRSVLPTMDIFAYPSTWPETSCLCLMEAMSAGLTCVHPNYAALYETAAAWTVMYQYQEVINEHANLFYAVTKGAIDAVRLGQNAEMVQSQKIYIDAFHDWNIRGKQWELFLQSLLQEPRALPQQQETFVYRAASR